MLCSVLSVQWNQVFRVKNSWGTRAPLNSNYLLAIALSPCMFNSPEGWGYSDADGLKIHQVQQTVGFARVSSLQTSQSSSESTPITRTCTHTYTHTLQGFLIQIDRWFRIRRRRGSWSSSEEKSLTPACASTVFLGSRSQTSISPSATSHLQAKIHWLRDNESASKRAPSVFHHVLAIILGRA